MNRYINSVVKASLLFIACSLSGTILLAQGIVFMDNPQWNDVLQRARNENKMIFVDCYTEWCGPCKGLERNIFPQKEMGDFFNKHFVNVKYDMEKENGLDFKKIFPSDIKSYPTLLYIDAKEQRIVHKLVGGMSVAIFIKESEKALQGNGLVKLQAAYSQGNRDLAFLDNYLQALLKINNRKEIDLVINDYLQDQGYEQLKEERVWNIVAPYFFEYESAHVRYVLSNKSKFDRLKFVDQKALDAQLTNAIGLFIMRILKIEQDEQIGSLQFVPQQKLFEQVRKDVELFNNKQGYQEFVSKLFIYEQLMNNSWAKAYEAVCYAQDFGFRYTKSLKLSIANYSIQESSDKVLLTRIYEDLKAEQLLGQKQFLNFNYYPHIAKAARKLGEEDVATEFDAKGKEVLKRRMLEEERRNKSNN